MSTTKRVRRHSRESTLTPQQELELVIGPFGERSAFANEAARKEAYFRHRDDLTRENDHTWAWVVYQAGGFLPNEGARISTVVARINAKSKT